MRKPEGRGKRTVFVSIGVALLLAACSEPQPQTKAPPPPPAPVEAPPAVVPPAPPPEPAKPSTVIRDGVGVGGVEIGQTVAEVEARLGTPERVNKAGDQAVYMSFHAGQIFGVYFDGAARVRMIILAVKDGGWCTEYDVCLYREGDLAKLKAHHGEALKRFVDRDGTVTYRLLTGAADAQVLTEYTPVEDRNGVMQVTIMRWTGPIDKSSFD
jgi:hypothetical protein